MWASNAHPLRLALPAAFQSLRSLLVTMADNLMVSSLDPHGSQFAVAQSNSITNFVNAALGLIRRCRRIGQPILGKARYRPHQPLCATAFTLTLSFSALIVLFILDVSLALSRSSAGKKKRSLPLRLIICQCLSSATCPSVFTAACIAHSAGGRGGARGPCTRRSAH